MSMPGAIETSRHYATVRDFRKDETKMLAAGWSTQAVVLLDAEGGALQRLLHRHVATEVDARYLRSNWPDES